MAAVPEQLHSLQLRVCCAFTNICKGYFMVLNAWLQASMIGGPFIAGSTITTADGALAPTVAFMLYILPKHFG
jgi:hypothetical protein